jgi:hypothetical protein
MIPKDKELYDTIKAYIENTYNKRWNAYYSGLLVQYYKALGGTYEDSKNNKPLKRWFDEEWKDIGNKEYPVYRPTKRITKDTPLTVDEIDKNQLKQQIKLKQKIKGSQNLPEFKKK